ncbi:MAG: hypothetical protein ACLP59_29305 [Bryobacteraceae bacterium]
MSGVMLLTTATAIAAGPTTYIRSYADFTSNTTKQTDLTPEDVQATSDGGYILLASSDGNAAVNWLVKTDSSGDPQWQKELGCFSSPPGDYTVGVSIQQTRDGGYILGGGATGCGTAPNCGGLSSTQCAIIEKLDSGGNPIWAKTYLTGSDGMGITSIKQTADGGYVAAGGVYAPGPSPSAALVLKVDDSGDVQWQRETGPAGGTTAWFLAIQQTSDGGYVATGNYYTSSSEGGLAVKLDASGRLQWQRGLTAGVSGSLFTDSIVQTSDGGYVCAGAWFGSNQKGGLLVKLDSSGNIIWQNAYSGGTHCPDGGCVEIGTVIYSVHQTADGGYILAGNGDLISTPGIVPWLGKVDASGNLLWQHFYYQVYTTGRPLSEYFAAAALGRDGGFVAAGWTEDYAAGLGLLYVVKTDSSGLCGSCSAVHPANPLSVVNPELTAGSLSLPVGSKATPGASSPSKTGTSAIKAKKDC